MEKSLIVIRGIAGCGKSTFAELLETSFICTADDYHIINGKYDWKPENVAMAHTKCQNKCESLMKAGAFKVVVANTSTTVKEMQPYYDMAKKYGYRVFSVIVENRHNGVSEHNVPEETLQKMRERFDVKL
jgi:predicted kinase